MNVPVVLKARKPSEEPAPRIAVEACFLRSDGTPVDFDALGGSGAQGPKGDKGDPGPQGPAGAPGVTQAATTSALGLVKKAAATSPVASPDAAQAAGESVSKAEFDKAAAVANECKRQLNDLLSKLKAAGVTA